MTRFEGLLAFLLILPAAMARAESVTAPIRVASPEAVFLDVARQIGGPHVIAEFVKRSAPHAEKPAVLIYDGGPEDRWVPGALKRLRPAAVVTASTLAPDHAGEGPSWYDLAVMGAVGDALAKQLAHAAPAQATDIEARSGAFLLALADLKLKSKQIVDSYGSTSVLLTDARFAPFCRSLGMSVVTIPPAHRGEAPEAAKSAIASRKGIVLIYNAEAPDSIAPLKALAEDSGLPLVGLRLTLPSSLSYQQWIGREINLVRGALNEAAP